MPQISEEFVPTEVEAQRSNSSEILNELREPLRSEPSARAPKWRVTKDFLVILTVALALRIPYFHGRAFPLNDGGMFAQIIDEIQAAHFRLPTHSSYNFLNIPLSYPPLAFYLAAFCKMVTGQNTVLVLTWLPLLLNLGTILCVYYVAAEIYASPFYACLAACCYASIGRSSEWLIMGGGLTRGSGILFAAIAILFFLRSRKTNPDRLAIWSGVFTGLAALAHLEGGMFAAFSLIILTVLLPDRRQNLRSLTIAGIVSIAAALPWIVWLARHLGFGPLRNAADSGFLYYLPRTPLSVSLLVSSTVLAIVGRFPYLFWATVTPLVMRRSGSTYATLVGGLCMVWFANIIVVLIIRRSALLRRWRSLLLVIVAMALSLAANGIPKTSRDRLTELTINSRAQLSPAEVDGMKAAVRLSPAGSKFFVFNQRIINWPTDMVAEWFPYIGQRQCINTVQGREWLENDEFRSTILLNGSLDWSGSEAQEGILDKLHPDYLFVAGPLDDDQERVARVLRGFAKSPPIYKNNEVEIYRIENRK